MIHKVVYILWSEVLAPHAMTISTPLVAFGSPSHCCRLQKYHLLLLTTIRSCCRMYYPLCLVLLYNCYWNQPLGVAKIIISSTSSCHRVHSLTSKLASTVVTVLKSNHRIVISGYTAWLARDKCSMYQSILMCQ